MAHFELMATARGVLTLLPVPSPIWKQMEDAERNRVLTPMIGYEPPLNPGVWAVLSDHMRGVHLLVPEGVLFAWGCRCGARHEAIIAAPCVIAEPQDVNQQYWLSRAATAFATDLKSKQWLLNHESCGDTDNSETLLDALGEDFVSVLQQWLHIRLKESLSNGISAPRLAAFAPTTDGGYDIWSVPIASLYPDDMSWQQACYVAQFGIRVWQREASVVPSAVALLMPESALSSRPEYLHSSAKHIGPEPHVLFVATTAHTFTINLAPLIKDEEDGVRPEGVERHVPWAFPMLLGFFAE